MKSTFNSDDYLNDLLKQLLIIIGIVILGIGILILIYTYFQY